MPTPDDVAFGCGTKLIALPEKNSSSGKGPGRDDCVDDCTGGTGECQGGNGGGAPGPANEVCEVPGELPPPDALVVCIAEVPGSGTQSGIGGSGGGPSCAGCLCGLERSSDRWVNARPTVMTSPAGWSRYSHRLAFSRQMSGMAMTKELRWLIPWATGHRTPIPTSI